MKLRSNYPLVLFIASLTTMVFYSCGSNNGAGGSVPDPCFNAIQLTAGEPINPTPGLSNGSITVSGTSRFSRTLSYSINSGTPQNSPFFQGLSAGTYVVSADDGEGCTAEVTITLVEDSNGVNVPLYSTQIRPIIETRCATTGCHVTGGSAPNTFASHAEVKAVATAVKTRTSDRTMPPSGSPALSDEEINLIAAWVDGGAPDN